MERRATITVCHYLHFDPTIFFSPENYKLKHETLTSYLLFISADSLNRCKYSCWFYRKSIRFDCGVVVVVVVVSWTPQTVLVLSLQFQFKLALIEFTFFLECKCLFVQTREQPLIATIQRFRPTALYIHYNINYVATVVMHKPHTAKYQVYSLALVCFERNGASYGDLLSLKERY